MTAGRRSGFLAGLLLLAGWALVPNLAQAQPGFYATPLVATAAVYDDNVFSVPSDPPPTPAAGGGRVFDREGDFITRFSAGVQGGYKSEPFTLLADYGIDADVYSEHSSLNEYPTRQLATVSVGYLPTRRLIFGLRGSYRDSKTARDLNLAQLVDPQSGTQVFASTNLEARPEFAREYSASSSVGYRWSRVLDARASYDFQRTEQDGSNESQSVNAVLNWAASRRHALLGGYALRVFSFGDDRQSSGQNLQNEDETSHTLVAGWRIQVTRLLDLSLQGGPRFSGGSADAEASARASYRLRRGRLSFAYVRSQSTAVGRTGVVDSDSFTGGSSYQITRRLGVGSGVAFSTNRLDTSDADVVQATFGVAYALTEWLSFTVSHRFAFQDERFDRSATSTTGAGREKTYHNIALIGVRAIDSWRVD